MIRGSDVRCDDVAVETESRVSEYGYDATSRAGETTAPRRVNDPSSSSAETIGRRGTTAGSVTAAQS